MYKEKYLKYKTKYIALQNQLGGDIRPIIMDIKPPTQQARTQQSPSQFDIQRQAVQTVLETAQAEKTAREAEKATLEAKKATLEAEKTTLEAEKATLEAEKTKLAQVKQVVEKTQDQLINTLASIL